LLSKDEGVLATAGGRVLLMGSTELFIVAGIVLVLFGGSQLPKLAKNLGSAQRELKKAMEDGKSDSDSTESK
jgi:sec-independent protein translocase protein TatA